MFDDDEPPDDTRYVAVEVDGQPVCPYCGDTLTMVDADGWSLCLHDAIDIWVPPRLRG